MNTRVSHAAAGDLLIRCKEINTRRGAHEPRAGPLITVRVQAEFLMTYSLSSVLSRALGIEDALVVSTAIESSGERTCDAAMAIAMTMHDKLSRFVVDYADTRAVCEALLEALDLDDAQDNE